MISTYEEIKITKKRIMHFQLILFKKKKKKLPVDSTSLMPVSSCTKVDLPLPLFLAVGSSSNISLCYIKLSFEYHFKVVYVFC
jgi:hypothetical protein